MRVYGPGPASAPAGAAVRRTGATGFSVPADAAPRQAAAASGLRAVPNLDALLALQSVDDPTERRRRGVKRGRATLDVLDEMKVAVLAGTLDSSAVGRLKSALGALQESTGDPGLDAVLAQIELRAEVELAKYSAR